MVGTNILPFLLKVNPSAFRSAMAGMQNGRISLPGNGLPNQTAGPIKSAGHSPGTRPEMY